MNSDDAPSGFARNTPSGLRSAPQRKRLFLIDGLPIRVKNIRAALGDLYELKAFSDGGAALAAMHQTPPDAVLVDHRTLSNSGGGVHRTKCHDARLKHVPFIIISDIHQGPYLAGDGTGATDHFLKRPIAINLMMDRIANSISENVEKAWGKLPPSAYRALRASTDMFQTIAQAVANNTPLERSQVMASCNPLVDCVREEQHKSVLLGLRNHHNFTYVHSMRVAVFMALFAKIYDASKDETTLLATGGYMHDVGNMAMSQALLNTSQELSATDWSEIREHVTHTGDIVNTIQNINPTIRVIAEQHHELLDGSGYPHGLAGLQINELARMGAIADTFAGLTDDRPYKQGLDIHGAFSIMEQMTATLDGHLLKLFREALDA